MDQRTIVGWGFRVCGLVIGLPSLVLSLTIGFDLLTMRPLPPASDTGHLPIGKYGLVSLLVDMGRGMGAALRGFVEVMSGLMTIAVVAGAALAVFGALLFVVGNGIVHRAGWARVLAILLALAFLAVWLLVASMSHGTPLFAAGCGGAIALWTLWVLCLRYA